MVSLHLHRSLRLLARVSAWLLLAACVAGLAGTATLTAAPRAQEDAQAKIDPQVLVALRSGDQVEYFVWMKEQADLSGADRLPTKAAKGAFVYNTLRATAERSQQDLRAVLDAQGLRYQPFYIANKLFVYGSSARTVLDIAARADVARITPNRQYQLPRPRIKPNAIRSATVVEPSLIFMRVDQVWAAGVDGDGAVLAGNDTGLQWDHPAIITHYRGWNGVTANHNYSWWDATGTYPNAPGDGGVHGTHTTGTMVGSDGGANQIGVAPGAKTIHCKNMTDDGGGDDLTFTTCFQWDLAPWDLSGNNPRPDLAPDAVNNSWGYWGGNYPAFEDEIDALQAAGIVVEVSSGNEGESGCSTLRSPGDHGQVLTTGSVNAASGSLPGTISSFSSRGPSQIDPGEYFPDVMAPGEDIRSSVPGGGYEGGWSGTSMAGPHVTGLIGLMWSANPALKGLVEQTYDLIKQTAVPLAGQTADECGGDYTAGPNNDWGYGAVDAYAAVEAALAFGNTGTLSGVVTNSADGQPLASARVQIAGSGWTFNAMTNPAGEYTRRTPQGVYTVTASLYGFLPVTVKNVAVTQDAVTTQNFSMTPAPAYRVSGRVTDATAGWPLYASITINGYPGAPVWTDPVTGAYSVTLVGGLPFAFQVNAWLDGYTPQARPVGPLNANSVIDIALTADPATCRAPGYTATSQQRFFRDFESMPDGFQVTGTPTWQRGAPTSGPMSAHSGANVWATNLAGLYNDGEDSYLISPLIDLSAYSGAAFRLSWWEWLSTEYGYDFAMVDVTADGGATWDNVYLASGVAATTWTERSVALAPSYASPNFRLRFHFSSDNSITDYGWYIDDVAIASVNCTPPVNGGLVVGNVVDFDTGAGLPGAMVQNQDGFYVTTAGVDDPAGAGFYTLFSPAGARAFLATLAGYIEESTAVNVTTGSAVRKDFALKSGRPAVEPAMLAATLDMGQSAVLPLTVRNQGSGAFAYNLLEMPLGFDPARARQVANMPQTNSRVAPTSRVDGGVTAIGDALFTVDAGATTGHELLNGVEWAFGSWWVTSGGATNPNDPNLLFQLDKDGAVLHQWEQGNTSAWGWGDLAFDGNYLYASDGPTVVQIDPHTGVTTGEAIPCPLVECLALAYDPASDHFWTAIFTSDIVEFDRGGSVINRFANTLGVIGAAWDPWSPGGPYLWVWSQDGMPPVLASQIDPTTGAPTGVNFTGINLPGAGNYAGGATIVVDHPDHVGQVILAGLHQANPDAVVGYDLAALASRDVAWLSANPISGTVAAGANQPVAVTLNAGASGIDQPGIYRATLILGNDAPHGAPAIPVQMTVATPPTWGKVAGVITSLGICDAAPAPLANAAVTLRSNSGVTHTVNTDGAGSYSRWVNATDNPYAVMAVAAHHLANQAAGVAVNAGNAITVDVNLRLLESCLTPAPAAVTATVSFGGATGGALTLRNTGAAAGAFDVMIYNLGRQIAAAQQVVRHTGGRVTLPGEPKQAQQPGGAPGLPRHSGGPDAFGYTFRDSSEADGPDYAWIEIAPPAGGTGIALTELNGVDDGAFFPVVLPFAFPFYGGDYTQLAVASNGALYFEDDYVGLANVPIPGISSYAVTRFIAPFWDDLVVAPGSIYYQDLGSMFVIEYYRLSGCCLSPGVGAWQVILFDNGNLIFQYQDTDFGSVTYDHGASATVGIQGDPATGLQYSFSAPALTDELAICFAYPGATANCRSGAPWLDVAPDTGNIAAGGQITLALAYNAAVPEVDQPGDYLARLAFRTGSQDRPAPVTATLHVRSPVNWGRIGGVVRTLGACDANPAPLRRATVTIAGSGGFSSTLETDAAGVYALWLDVAQGPFNVVAAMEEHTPQGAPGLVVPAGGRVERNFDLRWLRSCVGVAPAAITMTVMPGASVVQTLQLNNAGAVPGHFVVRERAVSAAAALRPSVAGRQDQPGFRVAAAQAHQRTTQGLDLPVRASGQVLAAGDVVQVWTPSANSAPWGIAYTPGGTVWVGEGWGANHMDEYLADGTPTGHTHSYTWNPEFGPADFTFNVHTGMLWVMGVSNSSCIYEVDPAAGPTGVSICPAWAMSERGLAYDPETDTFFGGSWNDGLIYRFAADGTILDTVDARLAVAGLAYNPDTQHLFVMENFDPNLVHVLDVADNYADLGVFAIPGFAAFGGAGLEIDCNGRLWAVQQMAGDVFQVESGESTSWCSVDLPWLAATPVSGTLASGQVTPLTVTIDTRALAPGVHHGGLRISHDSPSLRPLDIDVTVRVEFVAPPKSLYMPLVAR